MEKTHIIAIVAIVAVVAVAGAAFVLLNNGSSTYDDGDIVIYTNDNNGPVTQTFKKAPERIIAGNDTCLEILLYLGLGDKIVGVYYDEDEISDVVKKEYDKLKSRLDSKYFLTGLMSQAVATELEPDFIIGYKSSFGEGQWAIGSTSYWNKMGCNIMSLNTQAGDRTVNGLEQDWGDLGKIFDIKSKTDKFLKEYNDTVDKVAKLGKKAKIAILEPADDLTSFGGYGDKQFIGQELLACGGTNAFPDGGWGISAATVIDATDIEGMIIISFGDITPAQMVQKIKDNKNFGEIKAVKTGNMIGIGLSGTYGGPTCLETIKALAELIENA